MRSLPFCPTIKVWATIKNGPPEGATLPNLLLMQNRAQHIPTNDETLNHFETSIQTYSAHLLK